MNNLNDSNYRACHSNRPLLDQWRFINNSPFRHISAAIFLQSKLQITYMITK